MKVPPLVTSPSELQSLCAQWRAAGRFAFDTEFIRDETYDAKLCLIQVCDQQGVTLIDPVGGLDVSSFWELVTDPAVEKVVHAGKEDFDVCLRKSGKPPASIFDVQVAAGFVGHPYPLNLLRLVQMTLDLRITKEQTLTDWTRRPLTADQLQYAVDDVAHLLPLHGSLEAELKRRGRRAWAEQEFKRFEDAELYQLPIAERLVRIKGVARLDALGLEALRRLIEWRDTWAQERNRPTRALVRDDILVEIARRRPTKASDLEVLRGFPQAKSPKIVQQIQAIIEAAVRTPPEQRPRPIPIREEPAMNKVVVDVLSACLRSICLEQGVAIDLVGNAQRIRDLLDYTQGLTQERPVLLTGWREEFIGRQLLDVLAGKSELHLSGWPKRVQLAVVTKK